MSVRTNSHGRAVVKVKRHAAKGKKVRTGWRRYTPTWRMVWITCAFTVFTFAEACDEGSGCGA